MSRFVLGLACGLTLSAMAASSTSTVTPLTRAELRTAPSGTATIHLLARGDNAFVGRLELDGGGRVPTHRDATEEYIHVLQGGGTITIDGVDHTLSPGTTVYMPANAEVSYDNGPERLIALQVFAGPEPAAKYDGWTGPAAAEP